MDLYELKDKNFLASKIKNNKNFKELTRNIGILAQKNDLQENKPNTEKENIEDLNMHKLKNIDTYNNNSALSYFYLDKDEMYIIAQEIYEKVLKHRNKAAENSLDFKKASIPSFDFEEFLTKIINERVLKNNLEKIMIQNPKKELNNELHEPINYMKKRSVNEHSLASKNFSYRHWSVGTPFLILPKPKDYNRNSSLHLSSCLLLFLPMLILVIIWRKFK